eukprot:m.101410 g.101410  ORF g.101410 m.101410 type:complete len:164 (-) comp15659_c1_seq1:1285-1776(-)
MDASHYFYSQDSIDALKRELSAAVAAWTQDPHMTDVCASWTTADYAQFAADIVATGKAHANVLFGFRNQREGAQWLRTLFVQERVQQYARSPDGSCITSAGLRVDQSLGRSTRQSAVTGPLGKLNDRVDLVNPVFARGSDVPACMHQRWVSERQQARSRFGLA